MLMPIAISLEILMVLVLCWALYVYRQKRKNEGGLSMLDSTALRDYIQYLHQQRYNNRWHPAVTALAEVIYEDPVLRFNWEHGISQAENLQGKTGKDVLQMLNTIISVGPKFTNHSGNPYGGLTGFPIDALFIHLMQNQNGRVIFSNQLINNALKKVLDAYGQMLNSPISLTYLTSDQPDGWFSVEALSFAQDYSLFKCDPTKPHYGFNSWHEWFLRQFREGARIVGAGSPEEIPSEDIIVSPCESKALLHPLQPARGVSATSPFWLKDELYSLTDMFGKEGLRKGYWSLFEGGTVFQAFLDAFAYHHWHSPVDGTIADIYQIPGTYFYDRSQFWTEHDLTSPDDCQPFLSASAAKMVILIKADNPKIGYVGLILIGMVECSGVYSSKKKGCRVEKGEHIGNFLFGGSSYTMILSKSANVSFAEDRYYVDEGVKKSRNLQVNSYLAHVS